MSLEAEVSLEAEALETVLNRKTAGSQSLTRTSSTLVRLGVPEQPTLCNSDGAFRHPRE